MELNILSFKIINYLSIQILNIIEFHIYLLFKHYIYNIKISSCKINHEQKIRGGNNQHWAISDHFSVPKNLKYLLLHMKCVLAWVFAFVRKWVHINGYIFFNFFLLQSVFFLISFFLLIMWHLIEILFFFYIYKSTAIINL